MPGAAPVVTQGCVSLERYRGPLAWPQGHWACHAPATVGTATSAGGSAAPVHVSPGPRVPLPPVLHCPSSQLPPTRWACHTGTESRPCRGSQRLGGPVQNLGGEGPCCGVLCLWAAAALLWAPPWEPLLTGSPPVMPLGLETASQGSLLSQHPAERGGFPVEQSSGSGCPSLLWPLL